MAEAGEVCVVGDDALPDEFLEVDRKLHECRDMRGTRSMPTLAGTRPIELHLRRFASWLHGRRCLIEN